MFKSSLKTTRMTFIVASQTSISNRRRSVQSNSNLQMETSPSLMKTTSRITLSATSQRKLTSRKRGKNKLEQNFEKEHKINFNKDLEIKSEQSIRLDEKERKGTRPKTAVAKEETKAIVPKSCEVDVSKRINGKTTEDKKKELARIKLFRQLKNDQKRKKQLINKAVKKHVEKPPVKQVRPKSAKKMREIVIDENNENEYEKFLNLPQKDPEDGKENKAAKKLENGWIGIGIGSGHFGEDELKRDLNKIKEMRSMFNMPPDKPPEPDWDAILKEK